MVWLVCVWFTGLPCPGDDLYDVTLTDGDCRLRVTLDPGLNRLVERNVLQPGSVLRNATFAPAMAAQPSECPGASGGRDRWVRTGGLWPLRWDQSALTFVLLQLQTAECGGLRWWSRWGGGGGGGSAEARCGLSALVWIVRTCRWDILLTLVLPQTQTEFSDRSIGSTLIDWSHRSFGSSESQSERVSPTVEQCGLQWGGVEGNPAHWRGGGWRRGGGR